MPSIPTVPGSQMVRTPDAGLKLDAGALNAPNQARMNMGAAVGQAGQMLGDFAQKLQGAVNYGIAADADRKMRQTAAGFQQSLVGRTDEDQWETEWKEKSDELISSINEQPQVGPSVRRQLTQNFKDWQQSNAIEVRTMANKQKINRATERVGLAADEAAQDGDEQGVVAAIDGAVSNHLMLPEQAEGLKRQYLSKIDVYAGENYIASNPMGAVDFLEEETKDGKPANLKRLTPTQRTTLLSKARGAATAARTGFQNDLASRRFSGEVIPEEELTAAVDGRLVSATWAKSFKKQQDRDIAKESAGENAVTDFESVRHDIAAFDPRAAGGGTYEKLYARAMLLPERMATDAIAMLREKADPKNALNGPEAKSAFDAINLQFDSGTYGKFKVTVPDLEAPSGFRTITDQKKLAQAIANRTEVEQFARELFRNNPTITAVEANKQIATFQQKFTGPVVDRAVQASVSPVRTTAGPSLDQRQAAMKWLAANPDSPYAKQVRERLGLK